MEIRTLKTQERAMAASMLDAWTLAEGWSAGDRFRRQVEHDPTWADGNVLVAVENDRILAVVSIFPRHLRILGHAIPTGGVGNLFTEPEMRCHGIATELLERACDEMRSRGLELAILFPGAPPSTSAFFGKRGWHSWGGQQTILRRDSEATQRPSAAQAEEIELRPVLADDKRALQSVKSIHAAYAASRSGTVVRDDALWRACLELTPAPREEFWVARRGGLTVAYARAAIVEDVLTITELGRFEDGADALAKLIASLLEPRAEDPLIGGAAKGRVATEQLRSFLVLPTFDDIGLTIALEHRGIRSHPMDDARASFRCVNLIGLASRLDVDLLAEEDGAAFLRRILPPDAMVFWPADRF
jgi:GNAT superfamily N-acetyltransferase